MEDADLQARLKELYLPPSKDFVLVDVPDMRFVMIDGQGAADRAPLDHAVKWLFTAIYPIKRIARERMGKNFVEPPIMHVGPPSTEASTIARLHQEYLPAHNLIPNGYHHEIYLNDPKRVAPEKLKTVLRQPVRSSGT